MAGVAENRLGGRLERSEEECAAGKQAQDKCKGNRFRSDFFIHDVHRGDLAVLLIGFF